MHENIILYVDHCWKERRNHYKLGKLQPADYCLQKQTSKNLESLCVKQQFILAFMSKPNSEWSPA